MSRINIISSVGILDRCLSELNGTAASGDRDDADIQTIKHHAEDCAGLGNRVLNILEGK